MTEKSLACHVIDLTIDGASRAGAIFFPASCDQDGKPNENRQNVSLTGELRNQRLKFSFSKLETFVAGYREKMTLSNDARKREACLLCL